MLGILGADHFQSSLCPAFHTRLCILLRVMAEMEPEVSGVLACHCSHIRDIFTLKSLPPRPTGRCILFSFSSQRSLHLHGQGFSAGGQVVLECNRSPRDAALFCMHASHVHLTLSGLGHPGFIVSRHHWKRMPGYEQQEMEGKKCSSISNGQSKSEWFALFSPSKLKTKAWMLHWHNMQVTLLVEISVP